MKVSKSNVQKYVVKGQKIFIGLEDSKKTWKLCIRSRRMVIHETAMPAKYENLRNYLHNKFPECTISTIYEAGFKGFNLYDKMTNDGWLCIVTPPHTVTEEKCSRIKNDRIDCRRLSKNLENNDYKSCFVPDKQLREDRQVERIYSQVQKDIVKICNRIRRSIEFHGLDDNFKSGKWSPKNYIEAQTIITNMNLSTSLHFSFDLLFKELDILRKLQKEVLNQLKEIAESDRYKRNVEILESVPGIGFLTAIRLLLELGNVERFNRKEEFSNFLGLVPSDYSTGESERKGHITKQGNRKVREWLTESAWIAIRYDPVLLDKFQRVRLNSGKKKVAIVAVAHKLAIRIRTILLSNELYQIGVIE